MEDEGLMSYDSFRKLKKRYPKDHFENFEYYLYEYKIDETSSFKAEMTAHQKKIAMQDEIASIKAKLSVAEKKTGNKFGLVFSKKTHEHDVDCVKMVHPYPAIMPPSFIKTVLSFDEEDPTIVELKTKCQYAEELCRWGWRPEYAFSGTLVTMSVKNPDGSYDHITFPTSEDAQECKAFEEEKKEKRRVMGQETENQPSSYWEWWMEKKEKDPGKCMDFTDPFPRKRIVSWNLLTGKNYEN